MKLTQIIDLADMAYGGVASCWDRAAEKPIPSPDGDSLAWFIASEIHSVYDPKAGDAEQLSAACDALTSAVRELDPVIVALARWYVDVSARQGRIKKRRQQ